MPASPAARAAERVGRPPPRRPDPSGRSGAGLQRHASLQQAGPSGSGAGARALAPGIRGPDSTEALGGWGMLSEFRKRVVCVEHCRRDRRCTQVSGGGSTLRCPSPRLAAPQSLPGSCCRNSMCSCNLCKGVCGGVSEGAEQQPASVDVGFAHGGRCRPGAACVLLPAGSGRGARCYGLALHPLADDVVQSAHSQDRQVTGSRVGWVLSCRCMHACCESGRASRPMLSGSPGSLTHSCKR